DPTGLRLTPDDVLGAARPPALAPRSIDEASEDGDVLAFVPEGRAIATALLRGRDDAEREQVAAIYRGVFGSAARSGDADELLGRLRGRLAARPFDADALRSVLAAAQVGLPVDGADLERAIVQRASNRRTAPAVLRDLLWTAHTAARDDR